MQRSLLTAAILATGFTLIAGMPASAGTVLISADEAKLPPAKGAVGVATRGITRGPKVAYVSAADPAKSPMRLQLKFESFGGAKIDTDSLKVTYVKTPSVDLTPRLKPFIKPDGIDMPDAELPAGDHLIRVDVKDSDGRTATTSFTLKVAP
ncbi:hypothetical protein [Afipia clevelandensis]|uniref:CopC domain-containing protein n=1 Tax=Afipia clevelandensis ATCC 49720 TaxID=883079 RepID=K8PPK2_9BRAD|nr:hypothetical protein [Afipia clevelandensis]EKS40253.1 hypothetical protein HMPREF9696_00704 [Afipia clevelandensis ATCC 49720]